MVKLDWYPASYCQEVDQTTKYSSLCFDRREYLFRQSVPKYLKKQTPQISLSAHAIFSSASSATTTHFRSASPCSSSACIPASPLCMNVVTSSSVQRYNAFATHSNEKYHHYSMDRSRGQYRWCRDRNQLAYIYIPQWNNFIQIFELVFAVHTNYYFSAKHSTIHSTHGNQMQHASRGTSCSDILTDVCALCSSLLQRQIGLLDTKLSYPHNANYLQRKGAMLPDSISSHMVRTSHISKPISHTYQRISNAKRDHTHALWQCKNQLCCPVQRKPSRPNPIMHHSIHVPA